MKITFTLISFMLLFFCLLGCMPTAKPPLPDTINIIPPSPDVSPEIAAFSGIWEGKWGEDQKTIIVVEKIDNQKAEIIFSREKFRAGSSGFMGDASYNYFKMSVLPGPILEWRNDARPATNPEGYYQCPCKLTLEMAKDKDVLIAYWEYTDYKYKKRADLRRRQ